MQFVALTRSVGVRLVNPPHRDRHTLRRRMRRDLGIRFQVLLGVASASSTATYESAVAISAAALP